MAAALSFEHVSKHFSSLDATRSLRDAVRSLPARLAGRRRPVERVRALDDVSFEVEHGQSVALVGNNGAGKTTALKCATRIVRPSAGKIAVQGRIGALIEVGTGLHPDLTGRENIDLFGRILGLSRADVASRRDAIIDFAGIGDAIERPVKQYSSGMQLRLGFAVAAHLEPEILIVDEAIAVGDAAFQHKCLERMSGLINEGRTLIFVSHDLTAVEGLCSRAILLVEGRVHQDGPSHDVVRSYIEMVHSGIATNHVLPVPVGGAHIEIVRVTLHAADDREIQEAVSGEPLTVRVHYMTQKRIIRPMLSIGISDAGRSPLTFASMLADGNAPAWLEGAGHVDCRFQDLPLQPRSFEIWASIRSENGAGDLLQWQRFRRFVVRSPKAATGRASVRSIGPVIIPYAWRWPDSQTDDGEPSA